MIAGDDLIGRAAECRSLDALLDAVRAGESRALVLQGEAGIGKTALLDRLVAGADGFAVVRVTGVESEMELPFAAVHQVCVPMLDRLDGLPDPQRDAVKTAFGLAGGPPPDRLLIGLAILGLLTAAAEEAPVLCVVDDEQWLDRASAQVLAFVARRILADRVGMVFAAREPGAELDGFRRLVVEGLHDAGARSLLGAAHHVPLDGRVRDRIVAETNGNPLALVECSRGLTRAELAAGLGSPGRTWPSGGEVEDLFGRRVAALPEGTRRFLTVAAAEPTGDATTVWRAANALGLEPDDADPAIEADLVAVGARVVFRHPVVRSTAYRSAAVGDRLASHRALADALDPAREPDRCAWHRALGSVGPDEAIAVELEQTARRARARGGLAAAATLLERSATLTEDATQRGPRLLAAAANHQTAGSFEAAARLLAAVEAASLDERGRAQLLMLRGRFASIGGDVRDAPELLLRAARELEMIDATVAADTYLQAMGAAMLAGAFSRGARIDDIARAAVQCPRSVAPTTIETLAAALAQAAVDGPAVAGPVLQQVLDASVTASDIPFYGFSFLGAAATLRWDEPSMRRLNESHVSTARQLGALTMLPWALNSYALLHCASGDFDRADAMIIEADQIVEATGGNIGMSWSRAIRAGWRADEGASEEIVAVGEAGRGAGNAQTLKHALWGAAILHNGLGQYDRALVAGDEAIAHPPDWGTSIFFAEHIEAAVRSGDRAKAEATLREQRARSDMEASDWGRGVLRRSEALLAVGRQAEEAFREAIERLARTPLRPDLARTHLLFGEWLRRENRRAEARDHLRLAHELFTAMGARTFAERTRHELLATGETVRKRTVQSFDALTPQEGHIARFAAEGRTNPEIGTQLFISPRTVEWHLSKVFTKLGVSSRKDLRTALSTTQGPS